MSDVELQVLSRDGEITEKYSELRGDPAHVAVIRQELADREGAALDLSLSWLSVYIDMEIEYKEEVGLTQLRLEDDGKASTAAESTAKAMCIKMKNGLSRARYVKNFYDKTWQVIHQTNKANRYGG